jgi:proline racemase
MRWERTATVIGCHVGGEENDVIVGRVPPPDATMFEKKLRSHRSLPNRLHAARPVVRLTR